MITNQLNIYFCRGLNLILRENQGARNLLKEYNRYTYTLIAPLMIFNMQIDENGFMIPINLDDPKIALNAKITLPLELIQFVFNMDQISIVKHIQVEGDLQFAHKLLEILSQLHFSNVYTIKSPILRTCVNKIINIIRALHIQVKSISHSLSQSLSEYLLYESEMVATSNEINEFCNSVGDLQVRTDLMNQKIMHLML